MACAATPRAHNGTKRELRRAHCARRRRSAFAVATTPRNAALTTTRRTTVVAVTVTVMVTVATVMSGRVVSAAGRWHHSRETSRS